MTTIIICTYAAIGIAIGTYAFTQMRPLLKTAPKSMRTGLNVAAPLTALFAAALWPLFAIGVGIIYISLKKKTKENK